MKLSLPKFMLKLPGDLYFCKRPLWFSYKPMFHKIKGAEIRLILNSVKEGDILFRRYDGYLDTILMPSFWCHAALYVGNNQVVQAVGAGVGYEDILDFCRCDSLALYRPIVDSYQISSALVKANELVIAKTCYDWKFEKNNDSVYCTELVNECYKGLFNEDYRIIAGNSVITPDGLSHSRLMNLILEFIN